MKFKIDKREYRIEHTDSSINLYESKKVKDKESANFGKENEQIVGYYQGYDGLYTKVLKNHLSAKDKEIETFQDIVKQINQVKDALRELLEVVK